MPGAVRLPSAEILSVTRDRSAGSQGRGIQRVIYALAIQFNLVGTFVDKGLHFALAPAIGFALIVDELFPMIDFVLFPGLICSVLRRRHCAGIIINRE